MIIDTFDLATRTGVGSVDTAGPVTPAWSWEHWMLKASSSGSLTQADYAVFYHRLHTRFRERRPDLVVYEQIDFVKKTPKGHPMVKAFQVASRLSVILMVVCDQLGIRIEGVGPSTLKRFAAGNGNASKALMTDAAKTRLFGSVIPGSMPSGISTDEVDALWLAAWAAAEFGGVAIA